MKKILVKRDKVEGYDAIIFRFPTWDNLDSFEIKDDGVHCFMHTRSIPDIIKKLEKIYSEYTSEKEKNV